MFTIRRYRDDDLPAVLELHVLALRLVGAYLGPGPWDADLQDIPGAYLNNHGEFLIGEMDGRIVAMGALRRTDAERAEIKRMRTHPESQGRGYGTQILSMLEDRARELGYHTLHLDTSTVQAAAIKLYQRYGYHETHRAQVKGLVDISVIYLEKHLKPMDALSV